MLNRTFIDGQNAKRLPELHTDAMTSVVEGWSDQTKSNSTSTLQAWDASMYDSHARFVAHLAKPSVELLDLRDGESVLDIGCGDGYLTEQLCPRGGKVVGVDFSPELVNAARARGLEVYQGNAERLWFKAEFDAVFSNAAMHWMRDANGVARGVEQALKPGGRFVGEFAGAGNAQIIRAAIHQKLRELSIDAAAVDPWYLPDAVTYRKVLEDAGFEITHLEHFKRPVVIDYPIAEWIQTFGSPYLTVLRADQQNAFLSEVTEALKTSLLGRDGRWTVDYTRIRFRAVKPR